MSSGQPLTEVHVRFTYLWGTDGIDIRRANDPVRSNFDIIFYGTAYCHEET